MSILSRTALVTGAASGIGAAIAARLNRSGHSVVLLDVDATGLDRRISEIAATGGRAAGIVADLADLGRPGAASELVSRIRDHSSTLDVLVNAAGIAETGPTADLDMASYHRVLDVNLDGMVALTVSLIPLLRSSSSARVLNIGSVQGLSSAAGTLAYATSKGGVHAFTRSLAVDLAVDGILVNALAPGFVDTPMARLADGSTEFETAWFQEVYVNHGRIPLRRPARPDEVAAVAEFFVSADNTYVTGQVVAVDGGLGATF